MGFFERQRAKQDERMQTAARDKLRPGETIAIRLGASSHMSSLKLFLALFPGAFLLEYTGRGSYSSWVIGLAVGIWFGFVTRQYMLVLTDQRFLALRLKRLSSKNVDEVSGCELDELKGVDFKMGVLTGKLSVACGSTEERYRVARVYEERAKQLQGAVRERSV